MKWYKVKVVVTKGGVETKKVYTLRATSKAKARRAIALRFMMPEREVVDSYEIVEIERIYIDE
ncbi:hypothetical protein [uncultured Porphyromonas sp.]|uniref:hypothetical protein n=1 Tax=uncultured Porphyromonas sp. TaxID=159274 RepID=UPI00259B9B16|nr:hypothetical protein [uncultured Porphyromonas sp.]